MKTKEKIRREMHTKRMQLSASEMTAASNIICRLAADSIAATNARTVACYLPVHKEVNCRPLTGVLFSKRCHVVVPKKIYNHWQFVAYSPEDFFRGKKYGEEGDTVADPHTIDGVICPGLAFDKNGNRLGYGGGAYDQMLLTIRPDTLIIGVCYDFQLIDQLPTEQHDVRMDMVVTEIRTMKT